LLAPRPPPVGGAPLIGCPRLLIQYVRSYPSYWRPFLHPQPDDAPCRGDICLFTKPQRNSVFDLFVRDVSTSTQFRQTQTPSRTALHDDRPYADDTAYTTQQTRQTNIHFISGIWNRDLSNRAAADLRFRTHGYRLE